MVRHRIAMNAAYSHIFFEDAPFCQGNPAAGSIHCIPGQTVLLQGSADNSVDIVSASLNIQLSAPAAPLK